MRYVWNEVKNRANIANHGLGFLAMERFEWNSAWRSIDDREDYGELREIAVGFIGERLHHVTFVEVDDETVRILSLRRATKREKKVYVDET